MIHYIKLELVIIFLVVFTSCRKDQIVPEGVEQIDLLDSVNNLRLKGCTCGSDYMPPVSTLSWNSLLSKAAEAHAKDMYIKKYFDHISPDGTSPIQRAKTAGYAGNTVIENIGKGYINSATVMAAWKASEAHCRAMMSPASAEMGAYSYNNYWVQEFGN